MLSKNEYQKILNIRGKYPQDMIDLYDKHAPKINQDDMELISQPIDFLGLNMYRRSVVANGKDLPPVNMKRINPPGAYTDMGWEVHPEGLYKILKWVNGDYKPPKIYITGNGAAFKDKPSSDGAIHDERQVNYIKGHVKQAHKAFVEGVPLHGYFA